MSFKTLRRAGLFAGLLATLAACGNDQTRDPIFEAAYTGFFQKSDAASPQGLTDEVIAQTLAATDLPLILLRINARNSEAIAAQIERNGEHRTYGTAERQAIVLRHGMITGTRGLGGDLMSVEEDALLRLVRGRGTGNVAYVQRFLTAEDVTREISYRCNVEPDERVDLAQGRIRAGVTEMLAACTSEDGKPFVDYYMVDGSGEILGSRQWLGETTGYVTMTQLQK